MGWKKLSKTELVRLAVLLVYLPFSLYFDWQHFSFSERSSYLLYTICKLVQLFLLYLFLGQVLTALRKKRIEGKFRLALLIFAVLIVGLLLLWPGNWVEVDEFSILKHSALVLKVHYNQGLFATAIHIVGLMFFFHRGSIVLFQCALSSWIYADLIQQCRVITGRKARFVSVLLFSPVSLYYLYQPMRTFFFGILLILFLQRYLVLWNCGEKAEFRREILWLNLLVSGLVCIRTEIKFLLVLYPLMLAALLMKRKSTFVKPVLTAMLIMISSITGYSVCERNFAGGDSPVALSFIMPIYTIFQDPKFNWEAHREEVEAIDKVYAIEDIMTKTNRAYTLVKPRTDYTEKDMTQFLQSSTKLIMNYPQDFLRCRWNEFVISVGFDSEAGYLQTTENVNAENLKDWDVDISPLKVKTLNPELRNKVSRFLGGQFTVLGINMNFVFWAFWIPIVVTAELFLVALWEKRLDFVLVLSVLLIELAGVVLTAPVKYAMYYFANYLGGWYMLYLYCSYKSAKSKLKKGSAK